MTQNPLLIFDLEGTLGDVFLADPVLLKMYGPDDEECKEWMNIRPGLIQGLKNLRSSANGYNMVLATKAKDKAINYFVEHLRDQGFEFDAVYNREATSVAIPERLRLRHFKNLSQVYRDFGIMAEELEQKVLVIEDIQLGHNEIFVGEKLVKYGTQEYLETKSSQELIFSRETYHTYGNPLPINGYTPVVLLVPNPRSNNFKAMPMEDIVNMIKEITIESNGNFGKGFEKIDRENIIKLDTGFLGKQQQDACKILNIQEDHPFVIEMTSGFSQKYIIMVPGDSQTTRYEVIDI